jgi:predicted HicB family RNase H-like nuclease
MGNVRWFDKRVKEPEPPFFRFAVRCDRDTNRAIEKAAKRAGMTANAFVQAHFARILDEPAEVDG